MLELDTRKLRQTNMLNQLNGISRRAVIRSILLWTSQPAMFAIAGVSAFLLRFDFSLPLAHMVHLEYALPIWILTKSVVFQAADLNRRGWRYVSISDLYRLFGANFAASALSCLAILILAPAGFPRSIYAIDMIICFLGTTGMRLGVRMAVEFAREGQTNAERKNTLIYGAGDAGMILLREIRNNPRLSYRVVGFVDDRRDKWGLHIAGVPVLGGGDEVAALAKRLSIHTILIAIPSATGTEMTHILKMCHAAGAECKTVPGLAEVIEQRGLAGQIREVSVEDLLGRTPVHLDEEQILGTLEGKVVLVTGAAGSIGSELCRQIARFRPARIVGFEIAESPLFEIDREMREAFPHVPFFPEIGSIQNCSRIDEVLGRHKPNAIFHAAAYKHVPLMEAHAFEAIENNIFGTYNVAVAAAKHGVDDFVLISSDKAVRPTNVMGATKRVAELLLYALRNGRTRFIAVRFGNVLGSNGSVIPIFKKQIAAGGPVTVTHPEMRRFFMTIPEACQLVLQAAVIGESGQVCVLDMGQPVKIVDLARSLILLSGLKPDRDIRIEFTGMRPGEKLYEELNTLLEDTAPTAHDKIRIFLGDGLAIGDIQSWLTVLHEICVARDTGRLVLALKELVWDYNPSTYLLKDMIRPPKMPPAAVPVDWVGTRNQAEMPDVAEAPVHLSALGD
jgi:FlaA1/EpsC-like NDP-sugar epimerase